MMIPIITLGRLTYYLDTNVEYDCQKYGSYLLTITGTLYQNDDKTGNVVARIITDEPIEDLKNRIYNNKLKELLHENN